MGSVMLVYTEAEDGQLSQLRKKSRLLCLTQMLLRRKVIKSVQLPPGLFPM